MSATTCVHDRPNPTFCTGCRSLASAMGLLTASSSDPRRMLDGWYFEQLVDAWGRACHLAYPQVTLYTMRLVHSFPPEVRNLAPAGA